MKPPDQTTIQWANLLFLFGVPVAVVPDYWQGLAQVHCQRSVSIARGQWTSWFENVHVPPN